MSEAADRSVESSASLETHTRGALLELASELRRLEGRLSDLAASIPGPPLAEVRGRGGGLRTELASARSSPPTVLEAQLGAVEASLGDLGGVIALLEEAAETSADRLATSWEERQRTERRQALARFLRCRGLL